MPRRGGCQPAGHRVLAGGGSVAVAPGSVGVGVAGSGLAAGLLCLLAVRGNRKPRAVLAVARGLAERLVGLEVVERPGKQTCRLDCLLRERQAQPMSAPRRTPNAERSHSTRTRLMVATVECLAELGWSGTTTTVVAERAGVSRGAQLHHYPTKAALVVAAIEHLATLRRDEMRRSADSLPSGA